MSVCLCASFKKKMWSLVIPEIYVVCASVLLWEPISSDKCSERNLKWIEHSLFHCFLFSRVLCPPWKEHGGPAPWPPSIPGHVCRTLFGAPASASRFLSRSDPPFITAYVAARNRCWLKCPCWVGGDEERRTRLTAGRRRRTEEVSSCQQLPGRAASVPPSPRFSCSTSQILFTSLKVCKIW